MGYRVLFDLAAALTFHDTDRSCTDEFLVGIRSATGFRVHGLT